MQLRTVLQRYYDEHITYKTTDTPRIFLIQMATLNRVMGRKHIGEIGIELTDKYIEARTKDGVKGATIRGELNRILGAASWGLRHKWLAKEDMPVISLPAASPPKEEFLRRDEAIRLIDAAFTVDWRLGLFVVIGLFTAARPSRIRYLEWRKVDFESEIIDFRPDKYDPTETKKHYTRVRMMAELVPYLRRAHARSVAVGEGTYVLGHTKDLDYKFGVALKRAKLDGPGRSITPNTLRHTWATWSAMDGVDLWMIAQVLGNTILTVERKYAHFHPSYQREATKRRFFMPGSLDADAALNPGSVRDSVPTAPG